MICLLTATAPAAEPEGTPRIPDIRLLRQLGRYAEAIGYLQELLRNEQTPEDIRRQAHNELVTALLLNDQESEAISAARTALSNFHDLQTDPAHHPAEVNELYERLRQEMFGSLELTTDPPRCKVYCDGKEIGTTPMTIQYLSVGEHKIKISRWNYSDEIFTVTIEPNSSATREIALRPHDNLPYRNKFRVGVEFGVSIVSLSYLGASGGAASNTPFLGVGNVTNSKSAFRYGGAFFVDVPLHDKASFQPELRYVRLGNRAQFNNTRPGFEPGEYDLHQDYLAAPLLVKYYMHRSRRVFVTSGLEVGYLLSAKLSKTNNGASLDVTNDVKRINVSFIMGGGLEFPIKNHHLMFSAQYFHGTLSLKSDTSSGYGTGYKSREVKISTGFLY